MPEPVADACGTLGTIMHPLRLFSLKLPKTFGVHNSNPAHMATGTF